MADSTKPAITISRATAIFVLLALLGCAEEPTVPQEPLPPAASLSVEMSLNAVTLIVDSVVQLSAVVLDDEGDFIFPSFL